MASIWDVTRAKNATTEIQCAHSGIPTMRLMQTTYGREQMVDFLVIQINRLHKLLNIEHVMDIDTATFAAESILDEFGLLNFADLRLVFTRAIRGAYGQFYNRVTIPQMMDWFRQYFEDRCTKCAQASENESLQYKNNEYRIDPQILKFLNNPK